MCRNIHLMLSTDELVVLIASLNHYEHRLEEDYRHTERFYNNYRDVDRKLSCEQTLVHEMASLYRCDALKDLLLSHLPVPPESLC